MKISMKRCAAALVAVALLGGFLLPSDAAHAWGHGGGGGHMGGGHFGGGRFGGGHFGGGRFGGGHFNAMRGMHGMHGMRGMGHGGRHFSAGRFGRNHPTGHNTFSRLHNGKTLGDRAGLRNAAGRFNAGRNMSRFGNHQALQHASLSRQNAFFNKYKFGGKGFGRDHWGNRDGWHGWGWNGYGWYGYRWYGPVFWPYFWGDYFSFAFWPYAYYDPFWGYGPDVILWGAFWPYGPDAYDDDGYVYDGAYSGNIYAPYRSARREASPPAAESAAVAETCAGFAPGVSDLPVQQLAKVVDATDEQRAALEELKAAVAKASDILRQSCEAKPPLTPVARLDAMSHRLKAMEAANEAIKGPIERLYVLFTPEQKQRLEAMSQTGSKRRRVANANSTNMGTLCNEQAGFTKVPADEIVGMITLTDQQKQELEKLRSASAKASEELKNSCPASVPETVDGRLDAAQQRVAALIEAVATVRPAVHDFYASLTDEQKAALSMQPRPARNSNG